MREIEPVQSLEEEAINALATRVVDHVRYNGWANLYGVDTDGVLKVGHKIQQFVAESQELAGKIVVHNVDRVDWNTIKFLQGRVKAALIDETLYGAVFLSHNKLAAWDWSVRRSVLKLELPGIISPPAQVVSENLARLTNDTEKRLLMAISRSGHDYFSPEILESIAEENGIDYRNDPQFRFMSWTETCWDLRDSGVVDWDVDQSAYFVRPVLRSLLLSIPPSIPPAG